MITHQRLLERLFYDPETGVFLWKMTGNNQRRLIGQRAGTADELGRVRIYLDGRLYLAHRLAWFYVHGSWPGELDHRNGKPADNRIENLREATRSQNVANGRVRRTGLKGVTWSKQWKRWRAKICKDGKHYFLGYFITEADAHQAYLAHAQTLHGEFARAA